MHSANGHGYSCGQRYEIETKKERPPEEEAVLLLESIEKDGGTLYRSDSGKGKRQVKETPIAKAVVFCISRIRLTIGLVHIITACPNYHLSQGFRFLLSVR